MSKTRTCNYVKHTHLKVCLLHVSYPKFNLIQRQTCIAFEAAVHCRLYAFEAVGLLLGQEELAADEQQAYIAALLRPLIHQVCCLTKTNFNDVSGCIQYCSQYCNICLKVR